jgi:acetyltransferase-like isoleucine patch superfamily enzyme
MSIKRNLRTALINILSSYYRRNFTSVGSNLKVYRTLTCGPKIQGNGRIVAGNDLTILSWVYPVVLDADQNASIEIGNNVTFNQGAVISARIKVIVGDQTLFGPMVRVMDSDGHGFDGIAEAKEPIIVGRHVLICANAIILKGVTVGDNSIVAAGAVVTSNVAANTIVAGNPAKKIKDTKGYTE